MDKLTPQQEEQLLAYLDGKLAPADAQVLKKQLEESAVLLERLEQLRVAHTVLSANILEEPSSNFTHRIMANLHRYPNLIRTSPKNGLLLMFGTMVCTIVLAVMISSGVFDGVAVPVSLERIPATRELLQGPITFSGKWMMNGLIVLNLIIGFILLDKTVLRPLFGRRSGMEF